MDFISSALGALKPRLDDDFVDRLNYYYTCVVFLTFGLIVSARQWVGQPIECWVPAQFTGSWEEYAENYCFVQNTYWLPLTQHIPSNYWERDNRQIGYYQWIPFILAFQAFFFYFPYMAWWVINWQTGFDIHSLCYEADKILSKEPEEQVEQISDLAAYLRAIFNSQRQLGNHCVGLGLQAATHYGFYLSCMHLMTKLLFICNAIGQLFFMNHLFLIGYDYDIWNFFDALIGKSWTSSGIFPRVTMCDFSVRLLGNIHRYTVQCVLMINMFNEKMYVIIWYWTAALTVMNIVNFFYWISITINPQERVRYIQQVLQKTVDDADTLLQRKFALRYLRQDGILILRKIAYHASPAISIRLCQNLYSNYRNEKLLKRFQKASMIENSTSDLSNVTRAPNYRLTYQWNEEHVYTPTPKGPTPMPPEQNIVEEPRRVRDSNQGRSQMKDKNSSMNKSFGNVKQLFRKRHM